MAATASTVSTSAAAPGRWMLPLAGVLLALATALGAFGAHALQARLPPQRLEVYETAVLYHFFNALGLLGIGLAARLIDSPALRRAGAIIVAGTVLFSGSIYALTFGAPRAVGVVTPLGGLTLMVGWAVFAWGAGKGMKKGL